MKLLSAVWVTPTVSRVMLVFELARELFAQGLQAAGVFEHNFPLRSRPQTGLGAVKKLNPKFSLKLLDMVADGRLRQRELLCGTREAAGFMHFEKGIKFRINHKETSHFGQGNYKNL